MLNSVLGFFALGALLFLFKLCLPQGGKARWFIGTQWEPYVAVGITLAVVISVGWAAAGLIGLVV